VAIEKNFQLYVLQESNILSTHSQ